MLNAIKNSVLADRTLVIFTADHGELALSHMGYSRFYQAATTKNYEPLSVTTQQRPVAIPLRQKGPFVYQENNQLPLVVARLSDKTGSLAKKLLPTVNVDTPALKGPPSPWVAHPTPTPARRNYQTPTPCWPK